MLYVEFMNKVCRVCLEVDEPTNMWYIIPEYKIAMQIEGLHTEDVSDYHITIEDVKESLELEVIRRNRKVDATPIIVNWLFNIIYQATEEFNIEGSKNIIQNYLNEKHNKKEDVSPETEENANEK